MFSLSQYEIIIFYVLILWTFSAGAKMTEKKSHLTTTAMLPLHGFLVVFLAEKRACFIKSVH